MTLCDDCARAERDPLHCVYTPALCCKARAVAATPRKFQRQAFDAVCNGLTPEDADAVRVRAHELIRARKEAA